MIFLFSYLRLNQLNPQYSLLQSFIMVTKCRKTIVLLTATVLKFYTGYHHIDDIYFSCHACHPMSPIRKLCFAYCSGCCPAILFLTTFFKARLDCYHNTLLSSYYFIYYTLFQFQYVHQAKDRSSEADSSLLGLTFNI